MQPARVMNSGSTRLHLWLHLIFVIVRRLRPQKLQLWEKKYVTTISHFLFLFPTVVLETQQLLEGYIKLLNMTIFNGSVSTETSLHFEMK